MRVVAQCEYCYSQMNESSENLAGKFIIEQSLYAVKFFTNLVYVIQRKRHSLRKTQNSLRKYIIHFCCFYLQMPGVQQKP